MDNRLRPLQDSSLAHSTTGSTAGTTDYPASLTHACAQMNAHRHTRTRTVSSSSRGPIGSPSTSIKAALSDPRLASSLLDIAPRKCQSTARVELERKVRRYYLQLSVGCGDSTCTHKLCASCSIGPRLTPDAAAIMAVQLSSRPNPLFCPHIADDPQVSFPESFSMSPFGSPRGTPIASPNRSRSSSHQDLAALGIADSTSNLSTSSRGLLPKDLAATAALAPSSGGSSPKPFLHSLLSVSPFASLFRSPNLARSTENILLVHSSSEANDRHPLRRIHDVAIPSTLRYASGSSPHRADSFPASSQALGSETSLPIPMKTRGSGAGQNEPMAERSGSMMDLPSLLSATVAMSQRALWSCSGKPEQELQTVNITSQIVDGTDTYSDLPSPTPEVALESSGFSEQELEEESQVSLAHLTFHLLQVAVETYTSPIPSHQTDNTADESLNPSASLINVDGGAGHDNAWFISKEHGTIDDQNQHPTLTSLSLEDTAAHIPSSDKSLLQFGASGDPTFLGNTLRTVFSSAEALSRSFIIADKDINTNSSLLDIQSIRKSYHLILQLTPPDLFQTVLANALELFLAKLLLNTEKLRTAGPDLLRGIVIAMENPLLLDPRYHESLLKKLSLVIERLKSKSKAILITWFSEYDTVGFEKIIYIFQQYIVDHVHITPAKPDPSIIGATKALSILSHANEVASTPITPYTTFHMPLLAQKINFKEEYRLWKRSLEAQRVSEFSFFNYPFLFDPIAKTRILHIDARVQMSHEFEDAYVNQALMQHAQRFLQDSPSVVTLEQELRRVTNPYLVLEVRRDRLVDDVLDQIRKKEADLKKPVKVRFVGGGEEGQDQGGVQKEFFQAIVIRLLDPGYGMFVYEEESRSSWINGVSLEPERQFELVGIIIGLALYNGVMLGIRFPLLLYKKLVDVRPTFQDFRDAFPALGRGLQQLLDWSEGDVSDIFMRNFEISYDVYGQVKTYSLVRGGENIPVTNANRAEYVKLYVQHYADESIKRQFTAFRRGFHKVVGGQVLKICRPEELELLICGNTATEMDFSELQRTAEYDGFESHQSIIIWFWEIVHAMDFEHKKKLLNFVTASDRIPLSGFGSLTFVVQRNGPDTDRLPTALTCFGRLLLPEYNSKEKLFNRLTTAIDNATGFGLV
ncbi:hypothetical protein BASA83_012715 [Batrachochytrium salamandrivorans]|nr:hypothetical protein BASA83_012715 [Batrachochytrium salamandrivorans]